LLWLIVPLSAHAYTVSRGAHLDTDQPSTFVLVEFAASSFAPKQQDSEGRSFEAGSTFGLKNIDTQSRMQIETVLSELDTRLQDGQLIVTLPGDVLFDFDKADIRRDAQPVLRRFVGGLQAMGKVSLTVVGHTDSKGSDDYNQALSQRRAESVKNWLARSGVHVPISTQGKGKSEPVAPNKNADGSDNPSGRQKNRRVELIITQN